MLFVAFSLQAQDAVTGSSSMESVRESMTLSEMLETGGWIMYVMAAMSVAGLAFVIYFFAILRESQVTPGHVVRDIREKIQQGCLDEARDLCTGNRSPAAAAIVALAAIEYAQRAEQPDPGLLKEVVEGEGGRQAVRIQNQTHYLLDIGVIAPMVGLLGTVIGMLKAFNVVALDIKQATPMLLAAGVSQALITTAAGLIVGIPAMMFYAYFRGRSSKLISGLETASADLLTDFYEQGNP